MTPKLPPAQAGAPVQHLACFCTSISSPLWWLRVPVGSDPSLPPALPKGAEEGDVIPRLRYYSRE